ncbi:hypothetical protein A2W24_04290 [Microgenomates group bacterium RBG_16_45_19]|nr:MAG: hypothetical protein A2W24_04290 [Microgenomates group bacterium RBG_16_45_19]
MPDSDTPTLPSSSPVPSPGVVLAPKPRLGFALVIGLVSFLVLASLALAGYFYWQNQQVKKQILNTPYPSPPIAQITSIPSIKSTPIPETISGKPTQSQTLKTGNDWLTYTDAAAGITINYPPKLSPKYNPNRGAAYNFHAGSFLVDQSGETVLDFYFYSYSGGSRRQAFYDAVSFDGPENPNQYTQSTSDVSLNGRTYLKLKSTYTGEEGGRYFFLTPVGDRLYYFAFPANLEKDNALIQNLLTIIATSSLNSQSTPFSNQTYLTCHEYSNSSNKGQSWDANINNQQNMVVIQRFNQELKPITFDQSKIQLYTNLQTLSNPGWSINDFTIKHDPSQKSNYQDAIVITLPKAQVDKIRTATSSTIPSVSFTVKISQSLETKTGEWCSPWGSPQTYYTNYP